MQLRRGRVAITVPTVYTELAAEKLDSTARSLNRTRPHGCIHVGHARTLLIGEWICKEKGIPYHVRLDGDPNDEKRSSASGLFETMLCIQWLGIDPEKIYWMPLIRRPKAYYESRLDDGMADKLWLAIERSDRSPAFIAATLDDLVEHYPSLMIRGQEFVDPSSYSIDYCQAASLEKQLTEEDDLFSTTSRTRLQFTVPLIIGPSGVKLSKSSMAIPWDILTSVPCDVAQQFLRATVMNPLDPLAALGESFRCDRMSDLPYAWDWAAWGKFVQSTGGQDERTRSQWSSVRWF